MNKYRAKRACFHKGHYFNIGDDFVPADKAEKVPNHFVPDHAFNDDVVIAAAREDRIEKKLLVKAQKKEDANE